MSTDNGPVYKVLVLLYNECDILDYAGPMEVLGAAFRSADYANPGLTFDVFTTAADDFTSVGTGTNSITKRAALKIVPETHIGEVVSKIAEYDILLVPGGGVSAVYNLATATPDRPEIQLIKAFTEAPTGPALGQGKGKGNEKVLMSVCTGALMLGATGALDGIKSTTHHLGWDLLGEVSKGKTEVVKGGTRYVDGGPIKDGLRVITTGGISSGLDGALYLVGQLTSPKVVHFVKNLMEYDTGSKAIAA